MQKDITELSFFECQKLKAEINAMAAENAGELSDQQCRQLVEINTQSTDKLEKLCNFVKLMEAKKDIARKRIKEIQASVKTVDNTVNRIKSMLAGWVRNQGKKSYELKQYTLATRESTSVNVCEDFKDPFFCKQQVVYIPEKALIKKSLLEGVEIEGAELSTKLNLSIK